MILELPALQNYHVFVCDQVHWESAAAVLDDEVALEEAAAGDDVVLGEAAQERDAAFDGGN